MDTKNNLMYENDLTVGNNFKIRNSFKVGTLEGNDSKMGIRSIASDMKMAKSRKLGWRWRLENIRSPGYFHAHETTSQQISNDISSLVNKFWPLMSSNETFQNFLQYLRSFVLEKRKKTQTSSIDSRSTFTNYWLPLLTTHSLLNKKPERKTSKRQCDPLTLFVAIFQLM